jgi:hypothetical protein
MNSGRAKVFYRLNQRNRDGSSTFSSIISLNIKGKNVLTVSLHQNPVSSMLPVTIGGATGKVQLIIKDVSGKTVYASAATGNGYTSIAVDKLSKGIYILVAESDNAKQAFRFVKQ